MITIIDEFSKMPIEVLDHSMVRSAANFMPAEELAGFAVCEGERLGLSYMGKAGGRHLVIESAHGEPEQVERRHLYVVAPADQSLAGAEALVAAIVKRHGTGCWWSAGPAVGRLGRGEGTVRCAEIGGVLHVVLASYYYWSPRQRAAAVDNAPDPASTINMVQVGRIVGYNTGNRWITLDRAPELNPGDIVRVKQSPSGLFRVGECRVMGVTGATVHFDRPPFIDIGAIAEMDYLYLVRRPRAQARGGQHDPPAPKLEGLEAWIPKSQPASLFAEMIAAAKPVDPLDVMYDGVTLRVLLERDRQRRTEDPATAWKSHVRPSPAQRAAVSTHWSAELRAKVEASAKADAARRPSVVIDLDD